MPTPFQLKAPFLPGNFYHIVCKSNDGILLFHDAQDFITYKKKFHQYTGSFFEHWCYCLLNNHAHHIIKVNDTGLIKEKVANGRKCNQTVAYKAFMKDPGNEGLFDSMIERQMNSFLVSYVHYYNNKYMRKGGLFQHPFKRILVVDEVQLQQAIIYTHANAQKHGLVRHFEEYRQSSYNTILRGDASDTAGNAVINFFGGKSRFKLLHQEQAAWYYENNWPSSRLE